MQNFAPIHRQLYLLVRGICLCLIVLASCTPANAPTSSSSQQGSSHTAVPASPEVNSAVPAAAGESPFDYKNMAGLHFSGQGPATWPIQKEPGMVLVHIEVENCGYLVLSGKGQNIPHDPMNDQYQYYNVFQSLPNGEENIVLDYQTPYEDYDSPPQTEILRIEKVSPDCKWELSILPMSAARIISPGQIISGMYNDVLYTADDLQGINLLFNNPEHVRMLQDFQGLHTILQDSSVVCLDCQPEVENFQYESLPPGTEYLVIYSRGYWELQGK